MGIKTDKGKIVVDDYYMTNIPGYYAIGDVLPTQTTMLATEGITCIEKLRLTEKIDYGNIPGYIVLLRSAVGMTEAA